MLGSERVLLWQDRTGWDIMRALAMIKSEYKHDAVTIKAVIAIEKRVRMVRVESNHATLCSIHPNGRRVSIAARLGEITSAYTRRALA